METLKYNTPVEVSEQQYIRLKANCGGLCAFRHDKEKGKFYVKVWVMAYVDYVRKVAA